MDKYKFQEGKQAIPVSALRLITDSRLKFVAVKANADGTHSVSVLARSSKPIIHPYWGKIAHDLDGIEYADQVHADYCHQTSDVIGYFDKFKVTESGLNAKGKLIPFKDGDRATEVLHKQGKGMRYQASIDFSESEPVLEWVPEGQSTTVNGQLMEGPGVVVRQWKLSAIAICPRGADANTNATFESGGTTRPVLFRMEASMPKSKAAASGRQLSADQVTDPVDEEVVEAPVVDGVVVEETPVVEQPPAQMSAEKAELKRYVDAFGAEGAQFYLESKPFEECRSLQVAKLTAQVAELSKANADLTKRLSAGPAAAGHASGLAVGAVARDADRKSFFKSIPSPNHN